MTIFVCEYCDAKFTKEQKYTLHNCEKKKRIKVINTTTGRSAFRYYCEWRKCNNYKPPVLSTFIDSKYFNSFIKFVEYSKNMNIPEPNEYIKFMSSKQLLPQHWDNDNAYVEYIQYFDLNRTPREQVNTSITTLATMARIFECDVADVLDHLRPGEMIKLLQARKLSPWVLLFSDKFHKFLLNKVSMEQGIFIQNFINPTIWQQRFKNNPTLVNEIKNSVKNLKL